MHLPNNFLKGCQNSLIKIPDSVSIRYLVKRAKEKSQKAFTECFEFFREINFTKKYKWFPMCTQMS